MNKEKKDKLLLEKAELEKRQKGCRVTMIICVVLMFMVLFAIIAVPLFIISLIQYSHLSKEIMAINKQLGI